MKKLLLNRKPVDGPWGGGNLFVRAICENAHKFGYEIVHELQFGLDAILMVDPRYDQLGISANEIAAYKRQFKDVRVVHRVNECDARKGTDDMDNMLRACSMFTDATIFVSNWMRDYFKENWGTREQHVVYNGVNSDHFRPKEKEEKKSTTIVAHHWSNNPMKGFDIYEKLDKWAKNNEKYEFVYIGRDRKTFDNAIVIAPLFGQALGDELRQYDIYISASRFDPGPNHIIEALACGLPTFVHRDGGGAVEFAGNHSVYDSFEELILRITQNEMPKCLGWSMTWEECALLYFEIIEGKAPLFCGKIGA